MWLLSAERWPADGALYVVYAGIFELIGPAGQNQKTAPGKGELRAAARAEVVAVSLDTSVAPCGVPYGKYRANVNTPICFFSEGRKVGESTARDVQTPTVMGRGNPGLTITPEVNPPTLTSGINNTQQIEFAKKRARFILTIGAFKFINIVRTVPGKFLKTL